MTNPLISAIIFDLDGLVIDSEQTYQLAWQQAALTLGFRLNPEFINSLSGLSSENVQTRLAQHLGYQFPLNSFLELSCFYWQQHIQQHGIPVKPGFHELLALIKELDLPYCLATNSRRQNAQNSLAFAGLSEVFPLIISRDDVQQAKPAPEIFEKAAASLGLPSQQCLVLEDSAIGISAAKAANTPCIYIPSVYPVDMDAAQAATALLTDLLEVKSYLQQKYLPYS